MASFHDALKAFEVKAAGVGDAVVREAVLEVGRRVIDRSPIDTGRFASNWRYALAARDAFTTTKTDERFLHNVEKLPKKAAGHVHFISNALPYGPSLERGSSKQAPQGIVGLTVLEWDQIVGQAALKVAR